MQALLIKIVKNIGIAFLGKKVILALLRLYVDSTKNLLDDNSLDIVEGAIDGDIEKTQKAIVEFGKELARMAAKKAQEDA